MSTSLEWDEPPRCKCCGRTHAGFDKTYCSMTCARADGFMPEYEGDGLDLPEVNDAPIRINPDGPVMLGEVETEPQSDPRECNGCGTRVSVPYARTFAWENGRLFCAECRSRSERYTNDPVYGSPD